MTSVFGPKTTAEKIASLKITNSYLWENVQKARAAGDFLMHRKALQAWEGNCALITKMETNK